jgi:hypothetical protein
MGAAVFLNMQDIFNLLPNMNVEALSTSLAVKGNDMMAVIYLASLIRRCDTLVDVHVTACREQQDCEPNV